MAKVDSEVSATWEERFKTTEKLIGKVLGEEFMVNLDTLYYCTVVSPSLTNTDQLRNPTKATSRTPIKTPTETLTKILSKNQTSKLKRKTKKSRQTKYFLKL